MRVKLFALFLAFLALVHGQGSVEVRVTSRRELQNAVEALQSGQRIFVDADRLELTSTLTLRTRDVTLRGRGDTTVVCPDDATAFVLASPDLRLENLRIEGCRTQSAVVVEGRRDRNTNVAVERVVFADNRLSQGVAATIAAPLLIRRCQELPCEAEVEVDVVDCTFSRNAARQGGAIVLQDAVLRVQSSSFERNEGQSSAGAIYATGWRAALEITSTNFTGNRVTQAGSEANVAGSRDGEPLEIVRFWTFPFPSARGGAIDAVNVQSLTVEDSVFESNLAPAGGAVGVTVDITRVSEEGVPVQYGAAFRRCRFEQNSANYTEEILEAGTARSSAVHLGGALYVLSNSLSFEFSIEDSTLSENTARVGGALHLAAHARNSPRIERSHLVGNEATESGGAILLRNTGSLFFLESNCTNNSALLGGCMTLTNDASLQVEGPAGATGANRQGRPCFFRGNVALNGGAIICAACRDVLLREPVFQRNTALVMGGAIYVLESDHGFTMQQCIFQGNLAFRGGAVATEGAAEIRFQSLPGFVTQFEANTAVSGGAMYASGNAQRESRILLSNSVFDSNDAISQRDFEAEARIHAAETLLLNREEPIQRSWISECGEGGGGGLCLALNTVPSGAVVDIIVEDTLFTGNKATVGGGVYAAIARNGTWNQATLEGGQCPPTRLYEPCRALRFINVTITDNSASAGAGGIFVTQPQYVSLQCGLRSTVNQTLEEALRSGALARNDEICAEISGNSVTENGFAADGGADAHRLRVARSSRFISNHTSNENLRPQCSNCTEEEMTGLRVEVIDAFGQIITNGTPAARMPVTLVSKQILGERRYQAENGIILITDTRGFGFGDEAKTIEVVADLNPSLTAEIQFSTRSCFPGEEQDSISCTVCPPLQYAFHPQPPGCQQCEDHAVCTGGAALIPEDGYWHSTPFSPQFHECIVREACTFGGRTDRLSAYYADRHLMDQTLRELNDTLAAGERPTYPDYNQCAEGYTGVLCGSCEPDYGHFPGGECVECPLEKGGAVFIAFIVALWMAFFVGANIMTSLSSTHRQLRFAVYKRRRTQRAMEMQDTQLRLQGNSDLCSEIPEEPEQGSMDDRVSAMIKLTEMLKILVNYLQITSVAVSINMNWIGLVEALLSVELMLIGVTTSSHFVPLDCAFENDDDEDGTPNSIKVLWLRATFPLMLLLFFIIISSIYVFWTHRNSGQGIRRGSIQDFVTIRSYTVVVIIVVVFFSYISITSEFMRTINCIKVDEASTGNVYDVYAVETGDRVWAEDTALRCFKGEHTVTGVFGVLGLIFFSLAVIVFIVTWLPANAHRLDDPEFIAQYGFMYQGYKETWYVTSWEAVIAIRKALVAAAVVFAFPLGPNLQGVCAMGVVILAIGMHFIFSPFKPFKGHPNVPPYAGSLLRLFRLNNLADAWVRLNNRISLNALEAMSLLMSLVVFYSGILFNDDNTSRAGKYTMAAFTFAINVGFIFYMLYRLYYGAHVSVNIYCDHLRCVAPTRSVPQSTSLLGLVRKGFAIYRNRDVFRDSVSPKGPAANQLNERV